MCLDLIEIGTRNFGTALMKRFLSRVETRWISSSSSSCLHGHLVTKQRYNLNWHSWCVFLQQYLTHHDWSVWFQTACTCWHQHIHRHQQRLELDCFSADLVIKTNYPTWQNLSSHTSRCKIMKQIKMTQHQFRNHSDFLDSRKNPSKESSSWA